MIEVVRQWWQHEKDAMGKLLETFGSVPTDRREDDRFQRALDKFAHVIAARQMWLSRIADAEPPERLFPTDTSIAKIGSALGTTQRGWDQYMHDVDDDELEREITYTSSEGREWNNTVMEVITQAYTHGFYHRGQVALLISQLDGSPPDTDFIFYARLQNAHRRESS